MTRNALYATIGALAILSAVLTYRYYQDREEPTGLQFTVGEHGISVDDK
jgi:hypothetical protein